MLTRFPLYEADAEKLARRFGVCWCSAEIETKPLHAQRRRMFKEELKAGTGLVTLRVPGFTSLKLTTLVDPACCHGALR